MGLQEEAPFLVKIVEAKDKSKQQLEDGLDPVPPCCFGDLETSA